MFQHYLVHSLALLTFSVSHATYKGFVNPLKQYEPEGAGIAWLNISNSEPIDQLAQAIDDFLQHKDEYVTNVAQLSAKRFGHERCQPLLVDTQNIWSIVQRLQTAGFPPESRYVNIGAGDGHSEDPLYEYALRLNATGIAVERDPVQCERHRQALPGVTVQCEEVTPQSLASLFAVSSVPSMSLLDVLKVDIDSYDCPLLEVLLSMVTARIIVVEANPSIPPPYQWAMLYHPELWSFFNTFPKPTAVPIRGCSLGYEVDLLRQHGYDFVAFGGHDAIFTHHSVRPAWWPLQPPMDEFDCFNEAFITANGIPIDKTRRWFFQLNGTEAALPEIWEFFTSWMQENAPRLFPFALRS